MVVKLESQWVEVWSPLPFFLPGDQGKTWQTPGKHLDQLEIEWFFAIYSLQNRF